HGLLISGDGRHQMSVRRRSWIGIDHREKVVAPPLPPFGSAIGRTTGALVSRVTSPGKQVVAWCRLFLLLRMHRTIEAPNKQKEGDQKTAAHEDLQHLQILSPRPFLSTYKIGNSTVPFTHIARNETTDIQIALSFFVLF